MEARRHKRERTVEADIAIDPRPGHDDRLDLTRAMAKLAPAERAALTLCYALGYSHPEAGAILKMPLGTLKSHVLRGRKKLQILLSDREHSHD
jgi:RNA polymerase sigma-70 factor (ECF subfamily)